MGRITSYKADATMDKIIAAAKRSRPADCLSANTYFTKSGKSYFWEISPHQPEDFGLRGTIHLNLPDTDDGKKWCREINRFKIDGLGRLVYGPGFFKRAVKG